MRWRRATLLRAVATDGHRLAQAQVALPKGAKGMPGIIVPRKTVLELVKLIEGDDGEVEIALSASKIRFTFDGLVLTSKLIDGTFPDYERVIPRNNDKVARGRHQAVHRGGRPGLDHLQREGPRREAQYRRRASWCSPSTIRIPARPRRRSPRTMRRAARYRLQLPLSARHRRPVQGRTASFQLADAGSPTIVSDPGDDQALYVLMPMRV